MITQERLKELFIYNPTTGIFTRRVPRGNMKAGYQLARRDKDGYIHTSIDNKMYFVHRLAWLYVHGSFPPDCIDHKNRLKDDNRLSNLRIVTKRENQFNVGAKGYYFHKRDSKYIAKIKLYGKTTILGSFDTAVEAREAYLIAKKKYHTIKEYNE